MVKALRKFAVSLAFVLGLAAVTPAAEADTYLLFSKENDDGSVTHLFVDEHGYFQITVYDDGETYEDLGYGIVNPDPTGETQPGFTGSSSDVAESIEQMLNGKGGSLELIPEFWDSHVGQALLGRGSPHAAGYDPSPIDNLADGILNGGNPLDGGGGGGIDPLGGNIVDQLKNNGSGSGDDDDDGTSKPPAGSVPGGEELPGPAELVNPSPEDTHSLDAAMGVLPDVPTTDVTTFSGADITQDVMMQTQGVGAVGTMDPATTSSDTSTTEEPAAFQAADVDITMR